MFRELRTDYMRPQQNSPVVTEQRKPPRDYSTEMLIGLVASFLGSLLVHIFFIKPREKELK
ncbi:MAG: hypothetical protein DDT19_01948 [Syntrophomonadaceae bacterium]|nr:hypothetical protein [Bacillota bacterium]